MESRLIEHRFYVDNVGNELNSKTSVTIARIAYVQVNSTSITTTTPTPFPIKKNHNQKQNQQHMIESLDRVKHTHRDTGTASILY